MGVDKIRTRAIGDRARGISRGTDYSTDLEMAQDIHNPEVKQPDKSTTPEKDLQETCSHKKQSPNKKSEKIRRSVYWSSDIEDRLVMFIANQRIQRKRKGLTTISAVLEAALDKFLPKKM